MNIQEKDYSKEIRLLTKASVVYEALIYKIDSWWGKTDGSASNVGDVFKVSFGEDSFWKFEITQLIPNQKVVWKCVASQQDHHVQGMDQEWMDSLITWILSESADETIINFIHEGLVPSANCYDVCSSGWDFYLEKSLREYIEKGAGKPSEK